MDKQVTTKISVLLVLFLIVFGFNASLFRISNTASSTSIKVMSYNLHQFYVTTEAGINNKTGRYTFEELLKVIQSQNPDVLGLQESEGNRLSSGNQNGVIWLAEQLGMYYYYGAPTADQIYGVAILSKFPFISTEWKLMPNEQSIEREVLKTVIDSPLGHINVFCTHLQTETFPIDQINQVKFITSYVGTDPAIILGDFNSGPNQNYQTYKLMNSSFTYAFVEDNHQANDSVGFTIPTINPAKKIDFIWLSRGDWTVIPSSTRVVGNEWASDHLSVVAEISK